jgi:hypothetical protein
VQSHGDAPQACSIVSFLGLDWQNVQPCNSASPDCAPSCTLVAILGITSRALPVGGENWAF